MKKILTLVALLVLSTPAWAAFGGGGFGDGGSNSVAGGEGTALITVDNTYSMAGDSRLHYGMSTNSSYRSMFPLMWANDRLASYGPWFDLMNNYSQGGESLTLTVSSGRWASFIADGKRNGGTAANGFLFFGYNDMNPAGSLDQTVEEFLTAFEEKLDEALEAYDQVWIFSNNPLIAAERATYLSTWYVFPQVNAGFEKLTLTRPRAHYIDVYNPSLDTTSATLDAKSGHIQADTGDGVHETTLGAQTWGYAFVEQYGGRLDLQNTVTEGANLLPAFSGTGGTQVGTFVCTTEGNLPTDWTIELISGTGTATSVVVSDVQGDWKRIVFNNSAQANDVTFYIRQSSTARTALGALLANGETIQGSYEYQLHTISGTVNIGGFTRINNNNAYISFMGGKATEEDTLVTPTIGYAGKRVNKRHTIVAAPTSAEMVIEVTLNASAGIATLDIRNPKLVKLTSN